MASTTARGTYTPEATQYLMALTKALRDVPAQEADEILTGTLEELLGLDSAAANEKIKALGEPQRIAAEAMAMYGSQIAESGQFANSKNESQDPQWYSVVTTLLLIIGGFAIPFIGWVGGVIMLWSSKTWRLLHKIVGTLLLPAAIGAFFLIRIIVMLFPEESHNDQGGHFQVPGLSNMFGGASALLLLILIIVIGAIGGIWLLITANTIRRRSELGR